MYFGLNSTYSFERRNKLLMPNDSDFEVTVDANKIYN